VAVNATVKSLVLTAAVAMENAWMKNVYATSIIVELTVEVVGI
jgi:hypothetical protein